MTPSLSALAVLLLGSALAVINGYLVRYRGHEDFLRAYDADRVSDPKAIDRISGGLQLSLGLAGMLMAAALATLRGRALAIAAYLFLGVILASIASAVVHARRLRRS